MHDADRCLLFLVRHGATANNEAHPLRLQGCHSDSELSPLGRKQAAATAELLKWVEVSAVYASPLARARETAGIVAAPHRLEVELLPELTECDVGAWEGRAWSEIERDDPEAFAKFIADSAENPYAGGESLNDVRDRVAPVFDRLLSSHAGKSIVAVSHNVVNRVYLSHVLGWPIARARSVPQSNCGVNLIEWREGKTTVLTINAALHLES